MANKRDFYEVLGVEKTATDEELKNTKVSEISTALVEIVKFSISQIAKGTNGKNFQRNGEES